MAGRPGRGGRPPKPKEMHDLHGTGHVTKQRKKVEAAKAAPKPPAARSAAAPAHLGDVAKAEWARLLNEFASLGMVTQIDLGILAAYCTAYGRWVQAEDSVRLIGAIVKTDKGNLIQNPWLAVANRAMEQMHKYGTEFGMTPSSRVRLGAAGIAGDVLAPKAMDAPVMAGEDFETFVGNNPQALN